nr:hypothetical protein [Tanacetum cinerariifolium]
MTAKDVKSLALRHGIPLKLHPIALTLGWTMDKLSDDMIAYVIRIEPIDYVRAILSEPKYCPFCKSILRFYKVSKQGHWFSFEKRAILDAMAWRHQDLDINDPILEDGFSMQDVEALTERDHVPQHTTCPLSKGQNIPEKTDHQRRVEVEDPKIIATRERKARAVAKKKERKKQCGDGGEGSRPKTKQRKTTGREDGPIAFEATSSPEPIRTLNPHQPSGALAATAESRENHSPHESPRDSANRSVHNYSDDHRDEETDDLNLGSFGEHSRRALTLVNAKVIQPSPECQRVNRGPTVDRVVTPLRIATQGESSREEALYVSGWFIHRRCRVDNPMWCRELMVYLAPLTAQEESNTLNNTTALERAWFSLARGYLAQINILERFENLQTDFDRLFKSHAECGDLSGKFVQARLDLTHNSHLYTSLSDRHKALKNEHKGYAGQLEGLENCNRELSQANRDQVLRIKELEAVLAQKDSVLVYAERINVKQAQEKERLVSQVGRVEMEKFDYIRKLLPTMVLPMRDPRRIFLELMGRMEGFDVHADTKMRVEYDKLFERRYPYVEKISYGFHHSVSDLLKVYPDSPPHEQVPPHKPSSKKAPSTSASLGS